MFDLQCYKFINDRNFSFIPIRLVNSSEIKVLISVNNFHKLTEGENLILIEDSDNKVIFSGKFFYKIDEDIYNFIGFLDFLENNDIFIKDNKLVNDKGEVFEDFTKSLIAYLSHYNYLKDLREIDYEVYFVK